MRSAWMTRLLSTGLRQVIRIGVCTGEGLVLAPWLQHADPDSYRGTSKVPVTTWPPRGNRWCGTGCMCVPLPNSTCDAGWFIQLNRDMRHTTQLSYLGQPCGRAGKSVFSMQSFLRCVAKLSQWKVASTNCALGFKVQHSVWCALSAVGEEPRRVKEQHRPLLGTVGSAEPPV